MNASSIIAVYGIALTIFWAVDEIQKWWPKWKAQNVARLKWQDEHIWKTKQAEQAAKGEG